jgi:hypothetical protein
LLKPIVKNYNNTTIINLAKDTSTKITGATRVAVLLRQPHKETKKARNNNTENNSTGLTTKNICAAVKDASAPTILEPSNQEVIRQKQQQQQQQQHLQTQPHQWLTYNALSSQIAKETQNETWIYKTSFLNKLQS